MIENNGIPTKEQELEKTKLIKSLVENELEDVIKKSINYAVSTLTGRDNKHLYMENETIATQMLSVARKTYVAVYYTQKKEGEDIKKSYKITGLPMIDASTPVYIKNKLMECLDYVLYDKKNDIIKLINFVREDIKKQNLEEICTNIKVGSLDYRFDSMKKKFIHFDGKRSCPIQSRGAIHFNTLVDKGVLKNANKIIAGEKCFMLYTRVPNSLTNDNVLCFNDYSAVKKLFAEQKNREMVDFNIIFEKNFQQKLEGMSEILGFAYKTRMVNSLDNW